MPSDSYLKMALVLVWVLLCLCAVVPCSHQTTCGRGYMLFSPPDGSDVCVLCQAGFSFIPFETHRERQCKDCTNLVDSKLEVLVSPCNRTHDAELLCQPGYYRHRFNKTCVQCHQCSESTPTRPCQGYYDTVCCGDNNVYEAILNHQDRFICKNRSVRCGQGQFYEDGAGNCSPCPEHTYMQVKNHTLTQCLQCHTASPSRQTHSVILQECTRTSPTLFGCQQGYFRDPDQHELSVEVTCTRCQTCHQYPGKTCDMFHDTVCCPRPGMSVTAGARGDWECTVPDNVTVCDERQHLHFNQSDNSYECLPCSAVTCDNQKNHTGLNCSAGTCNDQKNHTGPNCHRCQDFPGSCASCPSCEERKKNSEKSALMFNSLACCYVLYNLCNACLFISTYWWFLKKPQTTETGKRLTVDRAELMCHALLHTLLFILRLCLMLSLSGAIGSFDEPYLLFFLLLLVIITSGWDNWIIKRNKKLSQIPFTKTPASSTDNVSTGEYQEDTLHLNDAATRNRILT